MKVTKEEIKNVPDSWDDSDLKIKIAQKKPRKKMDFITKFFIISFAAFILAISFLLFSMFNQSSNFSEKKIIVSAIGPATITSGEDGNVSVSISNNNKIPINEAYIIATYNSGENSYGDKNLVNRRIEIGDILPKTSLTKTFDFRVFGAEGTIKEISPVLYYKVPKSKAEFNKNINSVTVTVKTSPISINVKNLKEVHQNHQLTFDITVRNNTQDRMEGLIVAARNPNDFIYISSSLPLANNSPAWEIGSIAPYSEKVVSMTGRLTSDIGSSPSFSFFAGISDPNKIDTSTGTVSSFDNYYNTLDNIYSKVEKTVLVTGQYLDVFVFHDSSAPNYTLVPGGNLILELDYRNNLNYPLDKVKFTATLSGEALDNNSVVAQNSFFDKTENIVTWSEESSSEFLRVPALGSGRLYLNLRTKNDAKEGEKISVSVKAIGERNSEDDVSNEQDISFEQSWTVLTY